MAGPVADQRVKSMKNGYLLSARRDAVTGVVVILAILLFASTGGTVLSDAISSLSGKTNGSDNVLVSAFLLNIALILFGWRRYRDLAIEVEERAAAEQRAHSLAVTDPLTGLLNRRTIAEETADLVEAAERKHKSIAFMMLDLDNFKNINDVHGHSAGDVVLKQVANRLASVLPPKNLLARLGGDEFACAFIFDPEQPEMVERIADDLIDAIASPIVENGTHLVVTTSIGMSRYNPDEDSVDALMRQADIAMYSAKKRGLISPEVFIPIAEETGMIDELSLSVLRQSFEDAKDWDPGLTISVNISPIQLLDPWLAQKIVKLLVESGFPANRLEIEITESSLFENLSLAQSIVRSLKNQGIKIALDDFGTGYSSLAHLRALPFDQIKIDRSFVTSIIQNPESQAIVKAITGLGESLGMKITAEGIDSKEAESELRRIGCAKGQGWYYGRPLSMVQTREMLAERNLLPAKTDGEISGPQNIAPAQIVDEPSRKKSA